MKRFFRITGNFVTCPKKHWVHATLQSKPDFEGHILVSSDGTFVGESDEVTPYCEDIETEEPPIYALAHRHRLLAGVFARDYDSGEMGISFFKLSSSDCPAEVWAIPRLSRDGKRTIMDENTGKFVTRGSAVVTLEEAPVDENSIKALKKEFDHLLHMPNQHHREENEGLYGHLFLLFNTLTEYDRFG